jgi:hypothetical protein
MLLLLLYSHHVLCTVQCCDGVCTDLQTNVTSCGACGAACAERDGVVADCVAGACIYRSPACISAPTYERADIFGNGGFHTPTTDALDCCSLCQITPDCIGSIYTCSTGDCAVFLNIVQDESINMSEQCPNGYSPRTAVSEPFSIVIFAWVLHVLTRLTCLNARMQNACSMHQ